MFVSEKSQGRRWDTAHSWLNYSWPQNKKAAPSMYGPQDDCKSHSPGPRPERLPTLPHLLCWWPEPCCPPLSPDGLVHAYPGPWEATEHQGLQSGPEGSREGVRGRGWDPGCLQGFLETALLACSGDLSRLRRSIWNQRVEGCTARASRLTCGSARGVDP